MNNSLGNVSFKFYRKDDGVFHYLLWTKIKKVETEIHQCGDIKIYEISRAGPGETQLTPLWPT